MNKLKLYTDKKIVVTANPVTRGLGIAYSWGVPKLWSGIKWVGGKLAAPAFYVGSGAGLLYYSAKDEPSTNTEGLDEDEINEVNANLQNTITDFGIKYSAFYKDLYDKKNIYSDIIKYSAESQTGSGGDSGIINSKFMIGLDKFLDKFLADNISGGKNPFGLSEKQAVVYNEKLINFVEKIRSCSRTDLFLKKLDGQLNSDGGVNQIMLAAHENDPDSINELKGQSRVMDDEDSDDKEEDRRMSIRERNRAESKRLFEEMKAEDRARNAELELMEATRPESKKLDGGRIVDNLNWYIRLEQKIEDEGSGFFGMYNKFKKLPVFSFVRAQSRDAKFSKDSRQVKRRYSSILMSKSDPKYRTEIFEAPEYDIYPYYIKQRILILKFLKNELGPKFDSIYNQKMDEIESSNYADDGEFSIMPNKLAKALNKIIKSAAVTESYVTNANKFLTYFNNLIKHKFESVEQANTALGELKAFGEQKWGGPSFSNDGKEIGIEYISNKNEYNNVMNIFKAVFGKKFESKVPFGSFVKFIAGTSSYNERGAGTKTAELLKVLIGLKNLLGAKNVEEIKTLSENPVIDEPPAQTRPLTEDSEEPEEIKVIDEDDQYKYFAKIGLRKVMSSEGYKSGSVQMFNYNIDGAYNVTIGDKNFISKTSNSKRIDHYREVNFVEGATPKKNKTFRKPDGLYYYKVGLATIGGDTKNIFITNDEQKEGDQILTIGYKTENLSGNIVEGQYKVSGYFVLTSAYSGSSGDAKRSIRNILLNYSHEDESFSGLKEKLKAAIMSDANLKIRYPITHEKAVLINGKASQVKPGDDYRINEKRYPSSARFYLKANIVYSLKGGFSRISVGKNFWTLSLEVVESKDIFEEIYTYLNKSSQEVYMNPGILYYLNQREKNVYTKTLALIGFMLINQGFFVPGKWANEEIPKLVSQLKTFYDYALQKSSN